MESDERAQLMTAARQGRKDPVTGDNGVIVTSHPIATRAGAEVLRDGGNACDAALAAAIAQTVVEPHMTTIAGMMKLVYFDATSGRSHWLSGSHRLPTAGVEPLSGADVRRGLGVAVPGWWGAFDAACERLGTRPRRELMRSAIELAHEGADVYPQMYGIMYSRAAELGATEAGRSIFFAGDDRLRTPGERLHQRQAAATLEQLAEEGSDFFYRGEFARGLCQAVACVGGTLTPDDMAAYEAEWSNPVAGAYRRHQIQTSGPPDGGLNIIEALNMVELLDLSSPPLESAEVLYDLMLICQDVLVRGASQRDPASAPDATEVIISKDYARARLQLIRMAGPHDAIESPHVGTNHISVVDTAGSVAVLMHTCTASPWINGLFYRGFHIPAAAVWALRTTTRPGDRITIDGAENIAFVDGSPVLGSGSPSGSLLPCVLQNMINIIDFGMSLDESVSQPRFGFSDVGSSKMVLEASAPSSVRDALAKLEMPFDLISPNYENMGSYDAVLRSGRRWTACADPRRTGTAEAV